MLSFPERPDVLPALPGDVAVGLRVGLHHGQTHSGQQDVPPRYPQTLNGYG